MYIYCGWGSGLKGGILHGVDADGVGENVLRWKGRGTETSGGRLTGDIGTFECWDLGCGKWTGVDRDGVNRCESYTVVNPVGVGGKRRRVEAGDCWAGLKVAASENCRALKVGVGDLCLGTAFGAGDMSLAALVGRIGDGDARNHPFGGCLLC